MRQKRRPRGKNTAQMRLENRSTLLKLLRQNRHVCRKDLADMSGLTQAAVTNLIRDLMDVGLVVEDRDYKGPLNRNAVPLKIDFAKFLVIGVTVRRGRVAHAVSDLSGKIIEEGSDSFGLREPADRVLARLSEAVADYVQRYRSRSRQIVGIGASIPGLLDLQRGEISYLTNVPGWESIPIRDYVKQRFDFPFVMDEDANAAALAEKWFGCGRGYQHLISILAGKGVGAGLILNGQIHHGAFGHAGEVGHTSINFAGPQCECGNRGCLELYCSTLAVTRRAQEIFGQEQILDFAAVKDRFFAGDEKIVSLVRESGRCLGYAIVNLVNTFNPELVVVHGDMTELGTSWLKTVRETARERLLPSVSERLTIKKSTLEEDPVLLGTVAMVCEHLFDQPHLEYFTGRGPGLLG